MIPFLEIILTTLNTFYEEDLKDERAAIRVAPIMDSNEDEDGDRDAVSDLYKTGVKLQRTSRPLRINKIMTRCGLPGLYILFSISFFLYGTHLI